jgi:hypothetical protein
LIHDTPMTSAEKMRRHRAKLRLLKESPDGGHIVQRSTGAVDQGRAREGQANRERA